MLAIIIITSVMIIVLTIVTAIITSFHSTQGLGISLPASLQWLTLPHLELLPSGHCNLHWLSVRSF